MQKLLSSNHGANKNQCVRSPSEGYVTYRGFYLVPVYEGISRSIYRAIEPEGIVHLSCFIHESISTIHIINFKLNYVPIEQVEEKFLIQICL